MRPLCEMCVCVVDPKLCQKDEAFHWLDRALEERSAMLFLGKGRSAIGSPSEELLHI